LPFKEARLPLKDIQDAIGQINAFTDGMELDVFRTDAKTIAAVERKLLIISEAAIRLGEEAENLCPSLPWRDIRGIGNWLRHQYDAVDIDAMWQTIVDDLPPLQAAVIKALAKAPGKK
jgi:uncharacterized protein with HEPN domain